MSDQKNSEFPGADRTGSSAPALGGAPSKKELGTRAKEAAWKVSEVVQEAGSQTKETATSLAAEAGENAKRLMNKQVANGADFIEHVATSVKTAARSLDEHAPQLAKWAEDLAARADEFAASIRYQTVDELYASASEYARRQPTLMFGAAAACGFLLFRLFKANPDTAAQGQGERPTQEAGAAFGTPQARTQQPTGGSLGAPTNADGQL